MRKITAHTLEAGSVDAEAGSTVVSPALLLLCLNSDRRIGPEASWPKALARRAPGLSESPFIYAAVLGWRSAKDLRLTADAFSLTTTSRCALYDARQSW